MQDSEKAPLYTNVHPYSSSQETGSSKVLIMIQAVRTTFHLMELIVTVTVPCWRIWIKVKRILGVCKEPQKAAI